MKLKKKIKIIMNNTYTSIILYSIPTCTITDCVPNLLFKQNI